MPRVPQLSEQSVFGSTPQDYQRVQATPDAFGADVGRATAQLGGELDKAGDVMFNAAVKFQTEQNQTNVDDVYNNQFSPAFRDLYHKYYSLQGKDAVDQMPTFIKGMEDVRAGVVNTLPNDQQKHLFNQMSRRRVDIELDGMSRYADQQNKVWRDTTFESTLANYATQAADKHNSEQDFGYALGSSRRVIEDYAAATGKSAEWIQARTQKQESAVAVSRIQSQMVHDPEAAQTWYEANKGMIEPDKRPMLEHQLKAAVTPNQVKREAQDIMGPDSTGEIQRVVSGGAPFPAAGPQAASNGGESMEFIRAANGGDQVLSQTQSSERQQIQSNVAALRSELARKTNTPRQVDILTTELASEQTKLAGLPANVAQTGQLAPVSGARDTRAMLGSWIAEAERRYPNDPVKRDALVTQIKSNVSTIAAIQNGVAQQAHSTLTRLMMPERSAPPTTLEELTATPEGKQAWALTAPESQRGFISWLSMNQRASEGKAMKSNAAVNEEVFSRINLPANDPNKITQPGQLAPYFAKGLTRADYEWHTKLIDEQRTPDGERLSDVRKNFFSAIKPRFDASTLILRDEKGGEDNFKFQQYATAKEREYRAAGKDPYQLYNPTSKDYLGNDVPAFQRTLQQKVQDRVEATGTAKPLPPDQLRKPGESFGDWLKRTRP